MPLRSILSSGVVSGLLVFLLPCSNLLGQNNDPFGGDDPFGDSAPAAKAPEAPQATDPFGGPPVAPTKAPAKAMAQPFGGPPPVAKPTDDPFGGGGADPFGRAAKAKQNATPLQPQELGIAAGRNAGSGMSERIRATLDDETAQSFVETPLSEAVATLSRTHNIPILIDRRALEEIGLTPDQPVNLDLKAVTLRSFLRLMLTAMDCTYVIKDEVMQITTVESAEQNLAIRAYKMDEQLAPRAEKIVKALTSSVVPDAWNTAGGPCNASAVDHVLVVSATEMIHDEVDKFMDMLADAFKKQPTGKR